MWPWIWMMLYSLKPWLASHSTAVSPSLGIAGKNSGGQDAGPANSGDPIKVGVINNDPNRVNSTKIV